MPHAAAKATEAAAPEATEAATTASTRCMAGTPTYGYACGKLAQRVPEGEPMLDVRRREFITLLGGAAAAWPLAARAQQRERMRRIGVLVGLAADDAHGQARIAAFLQGLQNWDGELGATCRSTIRWGAGDTARYSRYAAELVALRRTSFWRWRASVVWPLLNATRTVPIVFVSVTDPVGAGFVASLARPGGNATGFTLFEFGLSAKWIELLKQIAPGVTRAAVLLDPMVPAGLGHVGRDPAGGVVIAGRADAR